MYLPRYRNLLFIFDKQLSHWASNQILVHWRASIAAQTLLHVHVNRAVPGRDPPITAGVALVSFPPPGPAADRGKNNDRRIPPS